MHTRLLHSLKGVLCAIILLISSTKAGAQVLSLYSFNSVTTTYVGFTNGTLVDTGGAIGDQRYATTLPFNFTLDNVTYSSANICANGYLSLGTTDPGYNNYAPISSTSSGFGVISAFGRDLNSNSTSTTAIRTKTSGLSPNRTFTIQWSDISYYINSGITMNFQIVLHETSNVADIIYGANSTSINTISGQVGLRGTNNASYATRTGMWSASSAGTNASTMTLSSTSLPSSGLMYTYTPPLPCQTPSQQPTALVLTAGYGNISGSFTACTADKYLVVRTPGTAPLSTNPVNGTTYTVSSTLGNGTVIAAGTATTFANTGLAANTAYTYTVFAYNTQCSGGPIYDTTLPISGADTTFGPRRYVWLPTSGSASFVTATNWVPTRSNEDAGDTLIFNGGGATTITDVPAQTVAGITVSNNTAITLNANAAVSFTLSKYLTVNAGTSVTLGGSNAITLGFSSGTLKPALINGAITLNGSSILNLTYAQATINGQLSVPGAGASVTNTATTAPANMQFNAGAVYNHQRDGGNIPPSQFNVTSTINITGIVSTLPTNMGERCGNLVWNCSGQLSSFNLLLDTVAGNLTIANTNTYALTLYGPNTMVYVGGNFIQQSGTCQIYNSYAFRIIGNAILNGGTLDLSNSSTATGGNVNMYLYGDLYEGAGQTITNSGTLASTINFISLQHQNVVINGNVAASLINYNLANPAGATLTGNLPVQNNATNKITAGGWSGTGAFVYNGNNAILYYLSTTLLTAGSVEWPAVNGPQYVDMKLTAPIPANRITLPGNRTVGYLMKLESGVLVLNQNNLTATGQFTATTTDTSSFIAADSTGQLILNVPATVQGNPTYPYWMIGDVQGQPHYAPVYMTVPSNSTARLIGMRVKHHQHPNDNSTANYLPRYWTVTDNGGTAAMAYKMALDFPFADTAAGTTFFMNRWNGTAWQELNSTYIVSGANIGVLQGTDTLQNVSVALGGADYTGRPVAATHTTYTWTGAVDNNFSVAGNWTPARSNPQPSDFLLFNNGLADTVKNVPQSHAVSRITITNNTAAIWQAVASSANNLHFDIVSDNDPTTQELSIAQGSTFLVNGSSRLSLDFTGSNASAIVDGRLEMFGSGYNNVISFVGTHTVVSATGVLASGGYASGYATITSDTNTIIYGTYENKHTADAGIVPTCKWGPASIMRVTGYTTSISGPSGTASPHDYIWNCPNQTAICVGSSSLTNISGTVTVTSTGTGQWRWNQVYAGNANSVNNYVQTGGTVDVGNVNFYGNVNQSGGTFFTSYTSTQTLNFCGNTGTQTATFFNAAPAGRIMYCISNNSGLQLLGAGALTSAFNINSSGGVSINTTTAMPLITGLTLQYAPTNSYLIYAAAGNVTADNVVYPATASPSRLQVQLSAPQYALTLPFSRSIADSLVMVTGNVNIGTNDLTIGSSATAPGGITYYSGYVVPTTGRLVRWYTTTNQPTTPGTYGGFYPLGYNSSSRAVSLYFSTTSALTTGGTIGVGHQHATGLTTGLSVTDGSYTINSRTNASWSFSTGNGISSNSGSLGARVTVADLINTAAPANLRLMQAASVVGTHVAGTGTAPVFQASRIVLGLSDLNNTTYYVGTATGNINNIWTSVATGNWNTPANWDQGTVPPAGAVVIIANNTTITTNTNAAISSLTIAPQSTLVSSGSTTITVDTNILSNGTLNMAGGTITLGPVGGGKYPFISNGALLVSAGTLNINGSMQLGLNSSFNQSGGAILIDGNAGGVIANSVPAGTSLFLVRTTNAIGTGGSITLVDPPIAISNGAYAFRVSIPFTSATSAGVFTPPHTFYFGDGVSTDPGGTGSDFTMDIGGTTATWSLGNVVVKGSPSGSNRGVFQYSNTTILGNLTLVNANAEYDQYIFTTYIGGDVNVGAGTRLDAGGMLSFRSTGTAPQLVSGAGLIRNSSYPTATQNFASIEVATATMSGVNIDIGDASMTGALRFTKGRLNMLSNSTLSGSNASTSFVTPGQTTGWVNGAFQLGITTGITSVYSPMLFAIGDATTYSPVNITAPTVPTVAGNLKISTTTGDHPAIATGVVSAAKSVNRYYTIDVSGGLIYNPGALNMQLNWNSTTDPDAGANFANFVAEKYNGTGWQPETALYPLPGSIKIYNLDATNIAGSYQVGEPGSVPAVVTPPAAQNVCAGNNATFTVIATGAATYQWQLNTGSGWTDITANATYGGVTTATLTLAASPATFTGYQYRCRIGNTYGTVNTAAAILTIVTGVTPAVTVATAPGTTVCAGTAMTFTATAVNGGTAPGYQWQVNGTDAGATGSTFTTSTLATGTNAIVCILTSNAGCATTNTATSTATTVTVNSLVSPAVTITASATGTICSGTAVTFTAVTTNGGTTPVYQWQKNGLPVGANQATYTNSALATGDVITCVLTGNNPCAATSTALSNSITMTVTPTVTPAVTIAASVNTTGLCQGTAVTFTATAANAGTTPQYQWQVNGVNAGTNSTTYTNSSLNNNDVVTCIVTGNATCMAATTATSNSITVTITAPVTPAVAIVAAPGSTICAGTAVTFTATPTNGGTPPIYQWKNNGTTVGTNSPTYTTSNLTNGNSITCVMTSNAGCLTTTSATSNAVTMTVNATTVPVTSVTANPTGNVCAGTAVTFTATTNVTGGAIQWQVNSANVGTGTTTYSYTPINADHVTAIVTTPTSACYTLATVTATPLTMAVTQPVAPVVTVTGATTICTGATATFTPGGNAGGTAGSYTWTVNGTASGTGSSFSYAPANGDIVDCSVTLPAGSCYTAGTATATPVTLTVNPMLTPSITISGPASAAIGATVSLTAVVTNAGSAYSINWKKNGSSFATTTTPATSYIKAAGNDTITAVVTPTVAGCFNSATTNTKIVTQTGLGIESAVTRQVTVSPNPFSNQLHVEGLIEGDVLMLTDITGNTLQQWTLAGNTGDLTIKDYAPGMYFLKVLNKYNSAKMVFRLNKQ